MIQSITFTSGIFELQSGVTHLTIVPYVVKKCERMHYIIFPLIVLLCHFLCVCLTQQHRLLLLPVALLESSDSLLFD